MYDRDLPEARTLVFDDPYPSWLSICLSRSMQVVVHEDATVGWAEDEGFLEALQEFQREGNPYLDASFPRLLSAMWPMNPGRLVYGDPRCLCIAPGRAAFRVPKFTLTVADWGVQMSRQDGWAAAPTAALADALTRLPTGKVDSPLTADACPWFMLANAEQDDLRRFVFAFAGLEVLASQVAKQ